MFIPDEQTISQIVRSNYRTAAVFKKFSINYCCSGQVNLRLACSVNNLDYAVVARELQEATMNKVTGKMLFNQWKIDFLTDYIINVHHAYIYETIPALESALMSFMLGHKKKYPELEQLHSIFSKLGETLLVHNHHEEEVLFPYIKQLHLLHQRKEPNGNLFIRSFRKPLSTFQKDHEIILQSLLQLRTCSNGFSFPGHACTTHQVLYHQLEEFYDNILQHKYLEDNILFPRAKEIEEQILTL